MNVFDCSLTVEPIRINKGIDSMSDVNKSVSIRRHTATLSAQNPDPDLDPAVWDPAELWTS